MMLSISSGRWMEHWWNDADKEEPKQKEENHFQYHHFVKHKSHIDRHWASYQILFSPIIFIELIWHTNISNTQNVIGQNKKTE